jgi:hypothetical protein
MTNEFKKISAKEETRYVLESGTTVGTTTGDMGGSIAMPMGGVQRRGQGLVTSESDKVKQKPRQGPLRTQTGGGKHKDKTKTIPRKDKYKRALAELAFSPGSEKVAKAIHQLTQKHPGLSPEQAIYAELGLQMDTNNQQAQQISDLVQKVSATNNVLQDKEKRFQDIMAQKNRGEITQAQADAMRAEVERDYPGAENKTSSGRNQGDTVGDITPATKQVIGKATQQSQEPVEVPSRRDAVDTRSPEKARSPEVSTDAEPETAPKADQDKKAEPVKPEVSPEPEKVDQPTKRTRGPNRTKSPAFNQMVSQLTNPSADVPSGKEDERTMAKRYANLHKQHNKYNPLYNPDSDTMARAGKVISQVKNKTWNPTAQTTKRIGQKLVKHESQDVYLNRLTQSLDEVLDTAEAYEKKTSGQKLNQRMKKHKDDAEKDVEYTRTQQALKAMGDRMKSKNVSEEMNKEHGSPYDCGGADKWYGRRYNPHKVDWTTGKDIPCGTPEEQAEYAAGYRDSETDDDFREGVAEGAEYSEYSDEVDMVENNLLTIIRACKELANTLKDGENLPEWVEEKISMSKQNMVTVSEYLQSQHDQGHVYDEDHSTATGGWGQGSMNAAYMSSALSGAGHDDRQMEATRTDVDSANTSVGQQQQPGTGRAINFGRPAPAKTDNAKSWPWWWGAYIAAHGMGMTRPPYTDKIQLKDYTLGKNAASSQGGDFNTKKGMLQLNRPAGPMDTNGLTLRPEIIQRANKLFPDRTPEPTKQVPVDTGNAVSVNNVKNIAMPYSAAMNRESSENYLASLQERLDAEVDERSVSQAQAHTMAAAAHNPAFAKKVGIKTNVAKEFNRADTGKDISKLPKRVIPKKRKK